MFFVVLTGFAIMVAVAAGMFLKKGPKFIPQSFRTMIAIASPASAILICFYAWQRIDYAIHESSGGGDYMGPMTMLVYGAPIFGLVFLVGGFVAAYVFIKS